MPELAALSKRLRTVACQYLAPIAGPYVMLESEVSDGTTLPVATLGPLARPQHVGRARRTIVGAETLLGPGAGAIEKAGILLQKIANTLRFEEFWRDKVRDDPRVIVTPTFDKTIGKVPIWNAAINHLRRSGVDAGTVLEFGTNNGGWLKYFVDRLPSSMSFVGFDCFEGLPEAWDDLPAGSIKGYGAPVELWADDPAARRRIAEDAEQGIAFPPPPQKNVRIESGLFAESLSRYLQDGWPADLRLVHFDADLYISTRPVLDTLCGPLNYRYLILFDEFYSVNHEFRAWREFCSLYALKDWRVLATSADGSQVLIEVNTAAPWPGVNASE
ncbi:hypothetical protein [Afifella sp. IM 167]|uniref:hypothetical protein n=1 Tax=Afifella sp. IM 167 TaxID=2033586 RepID=UPI001CC9BCE7|nr:hypothetical protein [Afifella sp. IM 167]